MRKTLVALLALGLVAGLTACGNTSNTTAPSATVPSSAVASSSVAEKKDDYIAIGGKTPYEQLTAGSLTPRNAESLKGL